jgi:hypothetical protein
MWHAWERREMCTRFGGKARRKETTWETKWKDGIRMDLREIGLEVWIGFDWLRTGTGGGLL